MLLYRGQYLECLFSSHLLTLITFPMHMRLVVLWIRIEIFVVLQIVVQGTVGSGIHNDIAIDDISLTPGCEVGGTMINLLTAFWKVLLCTDPT